MPDEVSGALFDTWFADQHLMVILRGLTPERTVEACVKAWELGITQVEVPIEPDDARESLEAAIEAGVRVGRLVGAGTVTRIEQVRFAARAGASFTVAPGIDEEVVRACAEHGLPHLPGVATAGEIQRAHALGCDWVKAFPASVLGSDWVRAMLGPFPGLKVVATGGMHVDTVGAFLGAGARVVALGSSLQDPVQLNMLARMLDGSLVAEGIDGHSSSPA